MSSTVMGILCLLSAAVVRVRTSKPTNTIQGAAWALAHVDKYSSGVVGEVCKPLPLEEDEEGRRRRS